MSTQSKAIDAAMPADDGEIRPFKVEVSEEELGELRETHRRDALAQLGARRGSVPGCAVGDDSGARAAAAAGQTPPDVSLPVAVTVFPGEIFRAPRSWAERVYPNLIYFNEVERGGHFAAWEEPELFTTEMRAAFNSLR